MTQQDLDRQCADVQHALDTDAESNDLWMQLQSDEIDAMLAAREWDAIAAAEPADTERRLAIAFEVAEW